MQRDLNHALLAVLTTLAVIAGLKLAKDVTLPLAFAGFLVALFWPVYRWLADRIPRGFAAVATLLAFLACMAVLVGGLWHSGAQVAEKWPQYADKLDTIQRDVQDFAERQGLSGGGGGSLSSAVAPAAKRVGGAVFGFAGGSVLVMAFLVLGLLEVRDFHHKISHDRRPSPWKEVSEEVASQFQRYVVVRTAVGLLNGVLVGLAMWALGLDFPFVWGLATFLLNYIPTIGSIVATIPPVLGAAVQFGSPGMVAATFAVVGGLQLVLGNYVDPLVQGKYLRLSPVVVLFSVVFWGWVWGVAGAFIGMPMTILVVLVCKQFDRTRWIATLLSARE